MKSKTIALLALTGIFALTLFFTSTKIFAGTSENLGGYAWSSNIGWVKLNNCIDPADSGTCSGSSYGVNIDEGNSGYLSGYAWSSNIGWISFESAAVSGCSFPINGSCRAFADWSNASGGVTKIKGFARACSVFASGCSGPLKQDVYRGGWDGYISLGSGSSSWGVTIDTGNNVSGYAWGSNVVGWLQFSGVLNAAADICPNLSGTQTSLPSGYVLNTDGDCVLDGGDSDVCPNIAGTQTVVPDGKIIDSNGNCVDDTSGDLCSNIPGIQTSLPSGIIQNGDGTCSNSSGSGDLCPNRVGTQTTVPNGMIIDADGNCKVKPIFIER